MDPGVDPHVIESVDSILTGLETVAVQDMIFPTAAVHAGLHDTDVAVTALLRVSVAELELPTLLPSPPYAAVIVAEPLPEEITLGCTVHAPEDSVHVPGMDNAPEGFWVKVTVPVGEWPDTVTVHVEAEPPNVMTEGLHDKEVVDAVLLTVSEAVPELPALLLSPPYVAVIVTAPAEDSVTAALHEPDDRAHVVPEGTPVPENTTVPPKDMPAGLDTVAVHVDDPPAVIVEGVHETEVEVANDNCVELKLPPL